MKNSWCHLLSRPWRHLRPTLGAEVFEEVFSMENSHHVAAAEVASDFYLYHTRMTDGAQATPTSSSYQLSLAESHKSSNPLSPLLHVIAPMSGGKVEGRREDGIRLPHKVPQLSS